MVFQKKGEKVASNAHQSFNQSSNNMGVRIVWCKKGVRIVWIHPSYIFGYRRVMEPVERNFHVHGRGGKFTGERGAKQKTMLCRVVWVPVALFLPLNWLECSDDGVECDVDLADFENYEGLILIIDLSGWLLDWLICFCAWFGCGVHTLDWLICKVYCIAFREIIRSIDWLIN